MRDRSMGGRRPGLDRFGSEPGTVVHGEIPITGKGGAPPELLTERENRVRRLLHGSRSLPEIVAELRLSPNMTKAYGQVI